MVDLFVERFEVVLFFFYIGIDVFGFWIIFMRKMCGGEVNFKRWVLMIICFVICVVYIEVLEEMIFLCFINVLRCFCVVRGEVKLIRLDCGINFVGFVKDLNVMVISIEDWLIKEYLIENGINWIFNFFYFFYMGGVWERMIGVVCWILDFFFLDVICLIYEVFIILMVEVMLVMNLRFLVLVLFDLELLMLLILVIFFIMKIN